MVSRVPPRPPRAPAPRTGLRGAGLPPAPAGGPPPADPERRRPSRNGPKPRHPATHAGNTHLLLYGDDRFSHPATRAGNTLKPGPASRRHRNPPMNQARKRRIVLAARPDGASGDTTAVEVVDHRATR